MQSLSSRRLRPTDIQRIGVPVHLLLVDSLENGERLHREVGGCSSIFDLSIANDCGEALAVLDRRPVDVLLANPEVLGTRLVDLLDSMRGRYSDVRVILLTDPEDLTTSTLPGTLGWPRIDYCSKPISMSEIERFLISPIPMNNGTTNPALGDATDCLNGKFGGLIGESSCMRELFVNISMVSKSSAPVLIFGETGTGKELVAHAIHKAGSLRSGPFVPVDCGAFASTLLESELFGYVRGAFTGAVQSKRGLLETADGGTMFLDEIGEMPLEGQSRLLRALQEGEFRPLGGTHTIRFNARVIAATNRDLESAVRAKAFREDLFYRLNVLTVQVPPLRERMEDIPILVDHFIEKYCQYEDFRPKISVKAMNRLLSHNWPGNVRELENCIRRALAFSTTPDIHLQAIGPNLSHLQSAGFHTANCVRVTQLRDLERKAILEAITAANGDKKHAARMLGIGVTTLYRKLREYLLEGQPLTI